MGLDVTRFTDCLFGYLYQDYKHSETSELSAGMPSKMEYAVPRDFPRSIGKYQIVINKILRPFFQPVFNKIFTWVGRNERTFDEYVLKRCNALAEEDIDTGLLFLALCAVVTELNLFFFQHDCFRFSGHAPKTLAKILNQCDEINEAFISDEDSSIPFSDDSTDGLESLIKYCEDRLLELELNPDFEPAVVKVVGSQFADIADTDIDDKIERATGTLSTVEERSDEDESDNGDPLMGACALPTSVICKYCKTANCSEKLVLFERHFILSYKRATYLRS